MVNIFSGHYPARAMPSAGVYPWLKSLLCDLQNDCFPVELPSEIPGQVNNPSSANTSIEYVKSVLVFVGYGYMFFKTCTSWIAYF